jgi:hypothetical protein
MSLNYKYQTKRTTRYIENIENINCFLEQNNFEVGLITSKYWGNFNNRKNPLITFLIDGNNYEIELDVFIKKVKPILNKINKVVE